MRAAAVTCLPSAATDSITRARRRVRHERALRGPGRRGLQGDVHQGSGLKPLNSDFSRGAKFERLPGDSHLAGATFRTGFYWTVLNWKKIRSATSLKNPNPKRLHESPVTRIKKSPLQRDSNQKKAHCSFFRSQTYCYAKSIFEAVQKLNRSPP